MYFRNLICALVVTACFSSEIPSSLKKCNRKNADFNQCLASAIEDAVSKSANPVNEINLSALDPLSVPSLIIDAGSGAVAFQQNYHDMKISGLSKIHCAKSELNFDAKALYLEFDTPLVRLDFQYEINGRLLLLPVSGKGPGYIEMEHLKLQIIFNFEEYEMEGKKHFRIANTKLILTPQLMRFQLDNLFDGDKALGDNINQMLNQNWLEVFTDVKPSYEQAFGEVFASIFENVLKTVSVTELFGDA